MPEKGGLIPTDYKPTFGEGNLSGAGFFPSTVVIRLVPVFFLQFAVLFTNPHISDCLDMSRISEPKKILNLLQHYSESTTRKEGHPARSRHCARLLCRDTWLSESSEHEMLETS